MNAGYAFINFKEMSSVKEFYNHFNGKRWRRNINARVNNNLHESPVTYDTQEFKNSSVSWFRREI